MVSHLSPHRVAPISTLRTHFTLVAEQVTAHSVDSRFAARANCTAAEDTCLFRAVATRGKIYLGPSDPFSPRFLTAPWHHLLFPLYNTCTTRLETRLKLSTGACIYYGDAASFHEWEFRTRPHIACKTGDQYIEAMSKVCDGLRCDAFVAAQEVGLDNLCEIIDGRQSGINKLISHMPELALPLTEHESKELIHQ